MASPLRYEFIRTPLERPLMKLRRLSGVVDRIRHPELAELHKEEDRIESVLERAISPGSNCVDIGVHYGSILSGILRLAPNGTHYGVEAIPHKCQFLRRKFPEVTLFECAVADEPGEVTFHINLSQSGFSGLRPHAPGTDDKYEAIRVPCRTLDEMFADAPHIDFVKLDVEGAEELVLKGARQFFSKNRPLLLFECGPSGAANFGSTPGACYDQLANELNYDVYFLKSWLDGSAPVTRDEFEQALVYPFKAFNWIAAPKR